MFGGKVYFSAWTAEHGAEPWVSYGSEFGTGQLADLNPGPASSDPCCFVPAGDLLFFLASDDINGRRLWVTNGTVGGTHAIDGLTSAALSGITQAVGYDGRLFFPGADDPNGTELWVSDGTPTGTVMVRDIHPGSIGSGLDHSIIVGDMFFFSVNDGVLQCGQAAGHGPGLRGIGGQEQRL